MVSPVIVDLSCACKSSNQPYRMTDKEYTIECGLCDAAEFSPITKPTLSEAKIAMVVHLKHHIKLNPKAHGFEILSHMKLSMPVTLNLIAVAPQEEE